MKKTIRLVVLLLTLATCVVGFTACSSGDKGHKHSYEETTVAATCTKQGYTIHKCSCGEEYVDSCVSAVRHSFAKGNTCERCGRSVSEGLEYKLNTDKTSYSVAGIGTCTDTDLIIPSTYDNLPVTSIGDHAFWEYNDYIPITSVTIPNSVTGIEQSAFSGCRLLTSVTVGNGLTYIGNQAFQSCVSLMSIEIPNGVTSIGHSAFYGCMKLAEIVNESNINITLGSEDNGGIGLYAVTVHKGGSRIIEKDDYLYITGDNGTNYMLGYVGTEKELVLPEKYNRDNYEIFNLAFVDFTLRSETEKSNSITSITISDGVTKIGDYAFALCNSLINVSIGDGVTHIGDCAFYYCGDLEKLTIGNGVESIGSSAFYNCTVSDCNEYDNGFYLGNATNPYVYLIRVKPVQIENLKINENCKFIGEYAASYCWVLGGVTFENSDGWCIPIDSSTQIYLTLTDTAENLRYLQNYGNYCWHRRPRTDVVEVSFVADGKTISAMTLSNGSNYKKIQSVRLVPFIPSVPEETGYNGAWNDSDLTSITTDITVNAEYSAKTYTLTLDYDGADGDNMPTEKIVTYNQPIGDLPTPTKDGFPFLGWQIDGNMITKTTIWNIDGDKTAVAVWKKESKGLEFEVNYEETEYTVTGIGTCIDTDLVIPSMYKGLPVTSIGEWAFYNCTSLESVTIGNSVESIGRYAFYDCSSLTSVTTGSNVKSIGYEAFYYCTSLESLTIGNSVESIGKSAFYNCDSLTSVTIGSNVESIGENAFSGCSSLTSVNYTGTIDEWVQISGLSELMARYDSSVKFYINNELVTEANITTATRINDYAFYGCRSLISVTIGDSVESIGKSAFYNCDSLTSVNYTGTIDEWVQISGLSNLMFYGSSAKKLYINNELVTEANITTATKINDYAFYNCSSLTSIVIPDSVESIGENAFKYCSKLVEVINKSSLNITKGSSNNGYVGCYALNVKTSGESDIVNKDDYLFYTYDNVNYLLGYVGSETNLTLPDSYNGENYEIYNYAFYKCRSLTSIVIPDSVKSIGEWAFSSCYSLTSVTFENPDGWYVSYTSTAGSGTDLDLSNAKQNATYLKSTYSEYYWYKA